MNLKKITKEGVINRYLRFLVFFVKLLLRDLFCAKAMYKMLKQNHSVSGKPQIPQAIFVFKICTQRVTAILLLLLLLLLLWLLWLFCCYTSGSTNLMDGLFWTNERTLFHSKEQRQRQRQRWTTTLPGSLFIFDQSNGSQLTPTSTPSPTPTDDNDLRMQTNLERKNGLT